VPNSRIHFASPISPGWIVNAIVASPNSGQPKCLIFTPVLGKRLPYMHHFQRQWQARSVILNITTVAMATTSPQPLTIEESESRREREHSWGCRISAVQPSGGGHSYTWSLILCRPISKHITYKHNHWHWFYFNIKVS